jgi:hypothetical protein
MHFQINSYLSYSLFALAILLWVGVGYFTYAISSAEALHASRELNLEAETLKQETTLRLHSLARETKEERQKLEDIAGPGIIAILDAVEAAGKDAGVNITFGRALGGETEGASTVRSAALAIEAQGSFAQVVRIAALLESLPVPSRVKEVRFEKLEGAPAEAPWRAVAEVQFITTADIST